MKDEIVCDGFSGMRVENISHPENRVNEIKKNICANKFKFVHVLLLLARELPRR